MPDEKTYTVTGMTCGHCELSVREEVEELVGVEAVDADRTTGRIVVRGEDIDDDAVRSAVAEAGYEVGGLSTRTPPSLNSGPRDQPEVSR